jgi:hypothetical protein
MTFAQFHILSNEKHIVETGKRVTLTQLSPFFLLCYIDFGEGFHLEFILLKAGIAFEFTTG